jgi:hypothetical protein
VAAHGDSHTTTPSELGRQGWWAYGSDTEPLRLPIRELIMADKSPRHSMSKKSGKSLKEKRTERKAKVDTRAQMERLTSDKKH